MRKYGNRKEYKERNLEEQNFQESVRQVLGDLCKAKMVSSHFNLTNGLPGNVHKLYCQPEPRKQWGFSGAWAMLTRWGRDKIAAISQTFLRAISGIKMYVLLKITVSDNGLVLTVQPAIIWTNHG